MQTHADSNGQSVEALAVTRRGAADLIGVHVSTVDKWIRAKYLPAVKIRGRVFIARTAIEELVAGERGAIEALAAGEQAS